MTDWFYISYARNGFLGAVFMDLPASTPHAEVLALATSLGLNPGGEALIFEAMPEAALAEHGFTPSLGRRLLKFDEIPGAVSIPDDWPGWERVGPV